MQTAAPGTCRRLQETLELFFQAIQQQAIDRAKGTIPDLESYIALRRDTSGCKCTWALIDCAYSLNLPEEAMEHPIIRSLGEATNDFVSSSNVTLLHPIPFLILTRRSCEQIHLFVRRGTIQRRHNMINVIMHE